MIDQGTYRSSACPYECTRTHHAARGGAEQRGQHALGARPARRALLLPGARRLGPGLLALPRLGHGVEGKLHPLHMSHGVTHRPVRRHRAPAPAPGAARRVARGQDHEDASLHVGGAAGRLRPLPGRALVHGRGPLARLLPVRAPRAAPGPHGHVARRRHPRCGRALVERARVQRATSKVCLWWSEFDLDDEEFSCRPKRDASNIVTPSILLATLAENDVAYPPPSPPPPSPPASPPPPSPPPGAIRCELTSIASTNDGTRCPRSTRSPGGTCRSSKSAGAGTRATTGRRLWRTATSTCRATAAPAGARATSSGTGGFKQSLLAKGDWDPLHQNNDDCSWKALLRLTATSSRSTRTRGATGSSVQRRAEDHDQPADEQLRACELRHQRAIVRHPRELWSCLGTRFIERFNLPTAELAAKGSAYYRGSCTANCYTTQAEYSGLGSIGGLWDGSGESAPPVDTPCILKGGHDVDRRLWHGIQLRRGRMGRF